MTYRFTQDNREHNNQQGVCKWHEEYPAGGSEPDVWTPGCDGGGGNGVHVKRAFLHEARGDQLRRSQSLSKDKKEMKIC